MRDALTVVPDSHKQSQSQNTSVTTIVKIAPRLRLYHSRIVDCTQHRILALVTWCKVSSDIHNIVAIASLIRNCHVNSRQPTLPDLPLLACPQPSDIIIPFAARHVRVGTVR